jgi:hypothetical protein
MAEVNYLIIGGLREDYFITHDHQVHLGVLGGNAVYAAAGAAVWTNGIGIVSRIGSNYPSEWLQQIHNSGIAIQSIQVLDEPQDTRTFYAYLSEEERVDTNPAQHFLRINQPLPKFLIDYRSSTEDQEERESLGPLTVRPSDLPEYLDHCRAVHIAPTHFITHSILPPHLQARHDLKITIDPSER